MKTNETPKNTVRAEENGMETIRRTKGVRRVLRAVFLGKPVRKYAAAGDRACGRIVSEARDRRKPGPGDSAILAWAMFDLSREVMGGFWDIEAA